MSLSRMMELTKDSSMPRLPVLNLSHDYRNIQSQYVAKKSSSMPKTAVNGKSTPTDSGSSDTWRSTGTFPSTQSEALERAGSLPSCQNGHDSRAHPGVSKHKAAEQILLVKVSTR